MAVDPQKLETELAKMVEGLKPFIEGKETSNVLSRLQIEVVPAFVRWKAGELNRGDIEENAILNAFVCFVASQLVGTTQEMEGEVDAQYGLVNRVLMAIGEECGAILSGARHMVQGKVPTETAH